MFYEFSLGSDDKNLDGIQVGSEAEESIPTKNRSLLNVRDFFDDEATSSVTLATMLRFFDSQSAGWSKYNILFAIGYIKINEMRTDIRITIMMLLIK